MKSLSLVQQETTTLDSTTQGNHQSETFIDMETIRRRVAKIKNQWTPEVARARASEGLRRRAELESLLVELAALEDGKQCEFPELSLVG